MNMRLIGARNVTEIVPGMVDASALHSRVGLAPIDNLYSNTCEPMHSITGHHTYHLFRSTPHDRPVQEQALNRGQSRCLSLCYILHSKVFPASH